MYWASSNSGAGLKRLTIMPGLHQIYILETDAKSLAAYDDKTRSDVTAAVWLRIRTRGGRIS